MKKSEATAANPKTNRCYKNQVQPMVLNAILYFVCHLFFVVILVCVCDSILCV